MEFFWFSRIENVKPQMWQIYIEAVVSPHRNIQILAKKDFELSFFMRIAIRGKSKFTETWNDVYNNDMEDPLNKVTISCPIETNTQVKVCDTFEVGIIGQLDYDMYDIAIMITGTPQEFLVEDLATLSFRLSHLNDDFLGWMAIVRIVCLVVTSFMILLYFVANCTRQKADCKQFFSFNLDQFWVLSLLIMCAIYNEPLFELRRNHPSVALTVLSEIPVSLFFTALLTYWLMGVTLVRVNDKKL